MSSDQDSLARQDDPAASLDEEVARLLDLYLAALEAGTPIDPERLLAEHPDVADQLRSCLRVVHLAERLVESRMASGYPTTQAAEVSGAPPTTNEVDDNGLHPAAAPVAQEPTLAFATAERSARLEAPGTIIGPYTLAERIGEGGMGTVYRAEQSKPVRRLVALKVIKPGMDTEQVLARFDTERQALALMDHPNIARVLDAGTTAAGRPYFVMELVQGVPITRYCDEARLTPRQRLELFIPVCQAIQHAHQKGIIHRDIKPSNVLVTEVDGKPVPKVIDFGVAKAIDQRLTERTLFTRFGVIVGTPEYMRARKTITYRKSDRDLRG